MHLLLALSRQWQSPNDGLRVLFRCVLQALPGLPREPLHWRAAYVVNKPDPKKLDLSLDTQLWAAVGSDWTLPLWVRWGTEKKSKAIYGVITPACGLYSQQELTLNALFEDHDIQGLTSSWIVPQEKIHGLLKKAPGVKPRAYYEAPDSMPFFSGEFSERHRKGYPRKINTVPQNHEHRGDFASYLSKQYAIPVSTVRAVLDAIGTEAPRWMIEFRKPINLGFCTLFAAPFRSNWKQIVAHKFKAYPMLDILKRSNRREVLRELSMPETLCSPQNIALKAGVGGDNHTLTYTIEAVPSERFELCAGLVGHHRQIKRTVIKDFEETVESLYELLLRALQTYLHKINLPFAKVHQSGLLGQPRLQPSRGDTPTTSGVGLGKLPVYIIPPASGFSVQAESRVENVVLPKVKVVSKVSPVLQATEDLRVSSVERDVEESGNGETGTAGVPL